MKLSPDQLEAKRLREVAIEIRFAANMADVRANARDEFAMADRCDAKANLLDPEGVAKPEPKKWNGYL